MAEIKPDNDTLRLQYQQNMENYRQEDRNIFQIPPIVITLASIIVGVAFGLLKGIASIFLLVFGLVFSIAMFISVIKIRCSQARSIDKIEKVEKLLYLEPTKILMSDEERKSGNVFYRFVKRRIASLWLASIPLTLAVLLLILIIIRTLDLYWDINI